MLATISPIHGGDHAAGPGLSEGDLAFYRENGYLMIEDAVSPEDLAELQAVARDFIDRSRPRRQSNGIYDLDEGHSPSNPRLTRISCWRLRLRPRAALEP
ncbi:MAG: hypothetical protein R3C69_11300 [Geminicoccaceae bacterium]